jgi:hypothetical protein
MIGFPKKQGENHYAPQRQNQDKKSSRRGKRLQN